MSSFLKHKANLFLGVAELNRMQKFLDDDGYRTILLKNSASFGVIKYEADPTFQNFKVVEDGAGSGNYKIEEESFAINSLGNLIRQKPISGQSVVDNGSWYWVKISHNYSTLEEGTVSIDINGNITGTGTKFTEVLRGMPNFPSKIKFSNSASNTLEYEIVEVINDTTALLAGTNFVAEVDLSYNIVGTFTPGHVPPIDDKFPFQYDSCVLSLEEELAPEIPPSKIDGEEFYIARVKNDGGVLSIHDKRTEQYKTTSEFNLTHILKIANPLIGVEWVQFKNKSTTRDENLIKVGWGARTTAWTLDAPNRAITLSTGSLNAGKYKSTSQFSDGELDGWRIYFKDGSFSEIHTSQKQGTAIKCTLKEVDPTKLTVGDELIVVPSVDIVEIRAKGDNNTIKNVEESFSFEASSGFGLLEVAVPLSTYKYVIEYRYIKNGETTEWLVIPSDTDNGYYPESSFDDNGDLILTPTRVVYTSDPLVGFIELRQSSTSYTNFIQTLQTGDRFGYGEFELDNGSPEVSFEAGTDYLVQRCKGVRGSGAMTVNHIIGLKNSNVKLGNSFTFIFDVGIEDAGFSLEIKSGYVDTLTPGTTIKSFRVEDFDYPYLHGKSVVVKCTWNGTAWSIYTIEEDSSCIDDVRMITSIDLADFSVSGKANLGTKYQGWALCNSQNGTLDLRERFIAGSNYGTTRDGDYGTVHTTDYDTIGEVHGDSSYKLTAAQSGLPSHRHTISEESQVTLQKLFKVEVNANLDNDGGSSSYLVNDGGGADNSENMTLGTVPAHDHGGETGDQSAQPAADFHENRPKFIVLGFLQRIRQV